MADDNCRKIEQLIADGTFLLTTHIGYEYEPFRKWERQVAAWLTATFPGQGLSGEWLSTGADALARAYDKHRETYSGAGVESVIRQRCGWLAKLVTSLSLSDHTMTTQATTLGRGRKVFLVHGHDTALRESVARLLEKLGLEPLILHEQPNKGRTIMEKFVDYSDVSFAVVLLTPNDIGGKRGDPPSSYTPRTRENVLLELGFFLGRLGRQRVCALYSGGVSIPSDYTGVLFVKADGGDSWRFVLAKELKEAGLPADLNQLV